MYFKGIIKNNETNFLACRIIGFVALIFLSFFPAARSLHTDVIAKSSFPLSGFFIIFIHFPPSSPFTLFHPLFLLFRISHRPSLLARRPADNPRTLFLFMPDARDITPALLPLIKSSNLDRFMRYIIFYCYVLQGFSAGDLAALALVSTPLAPYPTRFPRNRPPPPPHVRPRRCFGECFPPPPRPCTFFYPPFLSRSGGTRIS